MLVPEWQLNYLCDGLSSKGGHILRYWRSGHSSPCSRGTVPDRSGPGTGKVGKVVVLMAPSHGSFQRAVRGVAPLASPRWAGESVGRSLEHLKRVTQRGATGSARGLHPRTVFNGLQISIANL